jgi:hypothetical protein
MLPHLVDGRLPHVDIGQLSTVRRREPFVSDVRGDQHDPPPFRACRVSLALAVTARRGFEQSAFASRSTDSATGAERRPPDGRVGLPKSAVVDTQRDLEGVGGPSRITFSSRRLRFALKCCINGISVRALMRGSLGISRPGTVGASARLVDAIRTDLRRPSGNATTTYAGPRADRSGTTESRCPKRK